MSTWRLFGGSIIVAAAGLALGLIYGGLSGFLLAAILAVLEVSLSFDNAVVNATVLVRMNAFWQKIFLTVGVAVAVFGMRLLFPLLVVGVTAKLTPAEAIRLALAKGDPDTAGTYGFLLREAHPAIAAFGGTFLLLLFLDFVFEKREITWLTWLERPLARAGRLDQLSVVIGLGALALAAYTLAPADKTSTVLVSGILGMATYLVVNALGRFFETDTDADVEDEPVTGNQAGLADAATRTREMNARGVAGRAAFFLFLYLEVLDASFSFDGVVGAFAITSDPIIIAIGLGIGAMFIRSLTVFLVRKGTLSEFAYLEHGALWAIGALAVVLLLTIRYDVPELITGLIGVGFITAALASSIARNKAAATAHATKDHDRLQNIVR